MKIKLYSEEQNNSIVEKVLKSRGVQDVNKWINCSLEDVSSWRLLDRMSDAVSRVYDAVQKDENILVIVDCDVDGYTSSAILINYLFEKYPGWAEGHVSYLQHKGKEHGLNDLMNGIDESINLVICPDSASNDETCHEELYNRLIDIICLDHHLAERISPYSNTIIVNNQLCDYPNKEMSAAGVVWQFCRAYEEIIFNEEENDFGIDLCALGNLSDMQSYVELETRALIKEGLKNITNPFYYQMTIDNEYTLNKYGGTGSYKANAFAITPFINAVVRTGTFEEKDMVFRAMIKPWCFDRVKSSKRGQKDEEVPLYQEAAYLTTVVKRRQQKLETEALSLMEKKIKEENLLLNSIITLKCDSSDCEPNVRGLIANKIQAKYQRPCLVLTRTWDKDQRAYFYRGSGRNYSLSENQDLKTTMENTGEIEWAQGHNNAFGTSILEDNLDTFVEKMNQQYENIEKEPVYWVDYIWNMNQVSSENLLSLANMAPYWGQNIASSQVCLENIDLRQCRITLCGAKNNTIRIVLPNNIVLVKFQADEEEFEKLTEERMTMKCIVNPQRNEWNGNVSGEGIIETYELESKWIF